MLKHDCTRSLFLSTVLAVSVGCSSTSPVSPMNVTQVSDLQTQASVRVDPAKTPGRSPTLVTSVTLANITSNALQLPVAAYYPIAIRLYKLGSVESEMLAYDETTMPSSLVGTDLEIGAHGSRKLERSIPVDVLHAAGVPSGHYRVVAVLTASPPPTSIGMLEVAAGEIDMP